MPQGQGGGESCPPHSSSVLKFVSGSQGDASNHDNLHSLKEGCSVFECPDEGGVSTTYSIDSLPVVHHDIIQYGRLLKLPLDTSKGVERGARKVNGVENRYLIH
jgi:hypothetical protein